MRQSSFGFLKDYKKEFGGSLLLGKRKSKRPLTTKHPIHLILKSCHKGLFNPGNQSLNNLIRSQAQKFNIKIYDLAVNWSHIHLLIKLQEREDYLKFIRSLTSILVHKIREKKPELEQIFTLRPYSRILSWGKEFKSVLQYQILNQMESFGLIKRIKKVKSKARRKSSIELPRSGVRPKYPEALPLISPKVL